MQPIKVPEVGESITEGLLVEWHVEDGAYVEMDTPLFDVETDKVTITVNAEGAGAVKIETAAGTDVEIGQVVGALDTSAKKPSNGAKPKAKEDAAPKKEAAAAAASPAPAQAQALPETQTGRVATVEKAAPNERKAAADADDGKALPETAVSPSVRAFIRTNGLDLSEIEGTGPHGRITLEDAQKALKARERLGGASGVAAAAGPKQTRRKMSPIRKRIAERLVEAKNTTAMLTTFNEVDMSHVMKLRAQYKDAFEKSYGIKLGFMSFFVKAAIDALKAVPQVNAFIDETDIVENHYYDIGMAVSTEKGLVVPVIRDADKLSFAEVELAINDLAKRARDRKLDLSDLSGGVFSITNGGIFGSMLSTPILNPPQSAILGMHAIKKRAVVIDENTPNERIEARPMMYLALSYDHRLIDGAEAVTFLKRIVECIGDPQRLLLQV